MKSGELHFGVRPELPLRGFPAGRVRIRQRNTAYPEAFVKTDTGIRRYWIAESDGHWVPFCEHGSNYRPNPTGHILRSNNCAPGCSTLNSET